MSEDKKNVNSHELSHLFRKASGMMARRFHRRDHVHHAQAHVLSIIKEHGEINQRDLLEILDVRSSSLSEILGKLENNGFIERKRNEEDKRSFIVSLTEKAKEEMGQTGTQEIDFFSSLTEEDRIRLSEILQKIVASAKDEIDCNENQGPMRGKGRGRDFLHGHRSEGGGRKHMGKGRGRNRI